MKIGIVGWGLEGQSAYRYFGPEHEYLIVNESAQDNFPPESDKIKVQFLDRKAPAGTAGQVKDLSYLDGIKQCDKIVYQPTAYFNLKTAFGGDSGFWGKATTIQDIFFEQCPSKNIIGITGSKGKGTTSTLIAKILEASGKTAHLGGNIGRPLLDFIRDIKPDDFVVLELANFQLKSVTHSPHIGVCLMITKEHLDWHPDMDDYVEAKANMFRYQTRDDIAIYFADNEYSKHVAGYSPGQKIPYFEKPGALVRADGMIVIGEDEKEIINKTEVKLLGEHNLQNICAALTAVSQASGGLDNAKAVLSNFSGLEHRLELVRTLDGVKYYDDSFGTNPDTAIVAIRALVEPVILIVGGYDRGIPMDPLIDEILKDRVRHVVAIGQTGVKIAQTLKEKGYAHVTTGLNTMPEIVAAAKKAAQPGDAVLLSAAAASFDMFKNFEERGRKFKAAVEKL